MRLIRERRAAAAAAEPFEETQVVPSPDPKPEPPQADCPDASQPEKTEEEPQAVMSNGAEASQPQNTQVLQAELQAQLLAGISNGDDSDVIAVTQVNLETPEPSGDGQPPVVQHVTPADDEEADGHKPKLSREERRRIREEEQMATGSQIPPSSSTPSPARDIRLHSKLIPPWTSRDPPPDNDTNGH